MLRRGTSTSPHSRGGGGGGVRHWTLPVIDTLPHEYNSLSGITPCDEPVSTPSNSHGDCQEFPPKHELSKIQANIRRQQPPVWHCMAPPRSQVTQPAHVQSRSIRLSAGYGWPSDSPPRPPRG